MRNARNRILASSLAIIGGLLGVPSPAQAAYNLPWKSYTQTSSWSCTNEPVSLYGSLYIRACVIINANNDVQSVATVSNYTSQSLWVYSPKLSLLEDYPSDDYIYHRDCAGTWIAPGTTRACFGPTTSRTCSKLYSARAEVVMDMGSYDASDYAWSPARSMIC